MSKTIKSKITNVTEYLETLNRQDYWRLFIDGFRQKDTYESTNSLGGFRESQLGSLLWSLREPNGLDALKQTALELYSKDLEQELTFEFMDKILKSAYPFKDHLRLATSYVSTNGERMFGHITKNSEIQWIYYRGESIQKLVKSSTSPWQLQKIPQDAVEISTKWTLQEKLKYYPTILSYYNKNMLKAITSEDKIELIAQHMQDIECLHFFSDGNCRMMYLLLNKELMKNGFTPVILLNPNYFDQMTLNGLCAEIREGQLAFRNFLDTGKPYEDCLDQETILHNIRSIKIQKLKIFGDNSFTFEKSLEFTKETLIIFNDLLKTPIPEFKSFVEF